jgi:hypothetical protein
MKYPASGPRKSYGSIDGCGELAKFAKFGCVQLLDMSNFGARGITIQPAAKTADEHAQTWI